MKKMVTLGFVLAATTLGFSAIAAPNSSKNENEYTRSVNRPYEHVLAAVKEAAQAQGFRVSNVHNIAASLKKDGIQREPYSTVEVCNSKIAAQVLEAEPLLGSVMPCRIAVFKNGDQTTVSMIRPSKLMSMFPPHPEVVKAASEVERSMEAIVDAAVK